MLNRFYGVEKKTKKVKNTEGVLLHSIVLKKQAKSKHWKIINQQFSIINLFFDMKKLLKFTVLGSIVLFLNSCYADRIVGSGRIISETRTLSNTRFTEIRMEGSMDVVIKQGDSVKIVAKDYENVLAYLETRVSGNTLIITYRDHTWLSNTAGEVTVTCRK